jgi:Fe2+ transport system protein FeoA
MNERSMPLSLAGTGKRLKVTGVTGGYGLRRRLAELGLTPGVPVAVVSGGHPGPLLIDIRGSRLSLGFGVAQKIMVKEAEVGQETDYSCPGRQPQLG